MSTDNLDYEEIAERAAAKLEPGWYDGKLVLSRRQAVALAGSTFSAAALMGVGVGRADAQQAVGQVGTDSEPLDVFAAAINDGGPVTDGDGTERRIWLIDADAGDPADATAEDLIFEEEEA